MNADSAGHRSPERGKPDSAGVALLLHGPGIPWRAVDWACARASEGGQRSLLVLLGCRLWWRVEGFDVVAVGEADAAWYAMPEVMQDAVAERIWGWGLDPVISQLAGGTVAEVIDRWTSRPGLIVAARPGPLSLLSRRLVRELQRRSVPVTLIP
jgi:hypothetical protein